MTLTIEEEIKRLGSDGITIEQDELGKLLLTIDSKGGDVAATAALANFMTKNKGEVTVRIKDPVLAADVITAMQATSINEPAKPVHCAADVYQQLNKQINPKAAAPRSAILATAIDRMRKEAETPVKPAPVELMQEMQDYAKRYKKSNPKSSMRSIRKAVLKKFPNVKVQ